MGKKISIPKEVKLLGISKKKFAKKNDLPYKIKGDFPKKERKKADRKFDKEYATSQLDGLNKAIKILISNNVDDKKKKIMKTKDSVYKVINDSNLMMDIIDVYDKNPSEYKYILHLPNILMQSVLYYKSENLSDKEKKIAEKIDTEAYVELSERILRKPIKTYKKNGISKESAFQIACVIPSNRLFMLKTNFHYRKFIQALFDIAKDDDINLVSYFHAIYSLDNKFKKKKFLDEFCLQYLLRKQSNKSAKFTDTQKDLQENLTAWALVHLNTIDEERSKEIIKAYIKSRKRAEEYKTDGKRVISLINHSNVNSEYPKLKEVLLDIISSNSTNELYLS